MSILEHALKIGVAKPAENAAELNEKLSIVPFPFDRKTQKSRKD